MNKLRVVHFARTRNKIKHTDFWYGRDCFEHIGVDRRMVLKQFLNKMSGRGYELDSFGLG
jgi:hypothetical protein